MKSKLLGSKESYIDYSMIFIILFLLAFGLVMLYSTSSYEANLDFGDSAYYFKHQLVLTVAGLVGMIAMSYFPYRLWEKLSFVTLRQRPGRPHPGRPEDFRRGLPRRRSGGIAPRYNQAAGLPRSGWTGLF